MEQFWNGFEKRAGSLSMKRLKRIQGGVEKTVDENFRSMNKKLEAYWENKTGPVLLKEHSRNRAAGKNGTVWFGGGRDLYDDALARAKETQRKGGFKTLEAGHGK